MRFNALPSTGTGQRRVVRKLDAISTEEDGLCFPTVWGNDGSFLAGYSTDTATDVIQDETFMDAFSALNSAKKFTERMCDHDAA